MTAVPAALVKALGQLGDRRILAVVAKSMALTLAVFALYGLLAHRFRRGVIDSPRVQTGLRWVFSGAFAGLGLKLAADR